MKVALVFHGDQAARKGLNPREHRLGPTLEAFRDEGIHAELCVYNDVFADEVRDELLRVDGVQVWVNPITEDGHDRSRLDTLLREVAEGGVFVSSHPDAIQKIGTKSVLYATRGMGWVGDVYRYTTADEMRSALPGLLRRGPRVLKQHRGHSGQGIWKLTSAGDDAIRVKPAARGSVEEAMTLEDWVESCRPFLKAGPMIDQEYNPEIDRGTVRCYLVRDRVEGFGHQALNALVPDQEPGPRLYFPSDRPDFQGLKRQVEEVWLPQLVQTTGLSEDEMPCLWDMDFMLRGDGYMLCEINVSSVYPYPESAMRPLARAFRSRLEG